MSARRCPVPNTNVRGTNTQLKNPCRSGGIQCVQGASVRMGPVGPCPQQPTWMVVVVGGGGGEVGEGERRSDSGLGFGLLRVRGDVCVCGEGGREVRGMFLHFRPLAPAQADASVKVLNYCLDFIQKSQHPLSDEKNVTMIYAVNRFLEPFMHCPVIVDNMCEFQHSSSHVDCNFDARLASKTRKERWTEKTQQARLPTDSCLNNTKRPSLVNCISTNPECQSDHRRLVYSHTAW